jgi:hypothetical protein
MGIRGRGPNGVLAVVAAVALLAGGFGIGLLVGSSGDDDDGSGSDDTASAELVTAPDVSVVDVREPDEVPLGDADVGTREGSPLDDLPDGVTQLTDFGQRPDWSPDGSTIAFLDGSPFGDVWTVDVESGETQNLTEDFTGDGGSRKFARAYYLSNGDLLLCGPTSGPEPTPEAPEAGRFTGVMSVFRAPFDAAPVPLGVGCWEGMATSRTSLQIAWNRSDIDYTDPDLAGRVLNGINEVWTGELRYDGEQVSVVNTRKVLDRDLFGSLAVFEVQGFRPPDESELLVTAYAFQNGEVLGIDLETGEVRNYSNSTAYEEAEGVDATGDAVYVERDLEYSGTEPGALDIWRLGLDDGAFERVTYFNRYEPYYASNPSVAPNGEALAFQLSINGETEGQGDGILLLDLTS